MHFATDSKDYSDINNRENNFRKPSRIKQKTISLIQSEAPEAWKDIHALMQYEQSNRQVTTFRWSTRDAALYRELIKKQINSSLPSRKSTLYNEFSVRVVITRPSLPRSEAFSLSDRSDRAPRGREMPWKWIPNTSNPITFDKPFIPALINEHGKYFFSSQDIMSLAY